ncbi:uncharacterized protein LOC141591478 [Silene latifolia]|uniref:uncharacterized protein LOC141591478 n=1 Tax=Silene latifolia TaxID=37657 RepID=UPI003D778A2B
MGEVILFVDDYDTNYCRICHEVEYGSCSSKLEAPCACTGTVKFAHRECIQRWCNEKGNITCEICLQNYEPGYTAIPKQPKKTILLYEVVRIRGSLEDPRREEQLGNQDIIAIDECSSIIDRGISSCKTIALIITALLLLRYLFESVAGETHYPFSPATVIILRSCGVIIPMCIIIQTISALQNSIRRPQNIHNAIIHQDNLSEAAVDEEQALQI